MRERRPPFAPERVRLRLAKPAVPHVRLLATNPAADRRAHGSAPTSAASRRLVNLALPQAANLVQAARDGPLGASVVLLLLLMWLDFAIAAAGAVLVRVCRDLGRLATSATHSVTAFDVDGVEGLRAFGWAYHACIDGFLAIIHDHPRRTAHLNRLKHRGI